MLLDVNECLLKDQKCQQLCINTAGSYYCSCNPGYEISNDKFNCTDYDECQNSNTCQGKCVNLEGYYRCECPEGYTLNNDDFSCDGQLI